MFGWWGFAEIIAFSILLSDGAYSIDSIYESYMIELNISSEDCRLNIQKKAKLDSLYGITLVENEPCLR